MTNNMDPDQTSQDVQSRQHFQDKNSGGKMFKLENNTIL